ncbi:MAG: class I SAM-dependent methyltransferase [Bryobacteraceae bacterium]|jgi:SAM-dependent methyltransferase
MKDNMPQVARFWNDIAHDFDAIYSGRKGPVGRWLDQWLRKDIYQRFDWVMRKCGDVRGKKICDIGCGSGRFVSTFAKNGASRVVGVDVAPEMLKIASELTAKDGVADRCEFVNSDVLNWKTDERFDITIAIGFWDYIADPPERLRIIRAMTGETFLSAWPRFWTWRMPIRKVRLSLQGCPVYFFREPEVRRLLSEAGFKVVSVEVVGKLFCVESIPS